MHFITLFLWRASEKRFDVPISFFSCNSCGNIKPNKLQTPSYQGFFILFHPPPPFVFSIYSIFSILQFSCFIYYHLFLYNLFSTRSYFLPAAN
ncbi:hypothetical protein BX661DRAFT_16692 [Kickxella alabastrina]|uniref:uncharacterized protein n=1 Tax=Kickxella alabastrina TaxID=61397 RepID=UPI00221F4545|nr:uncharacterized protein BX661DRAFT_16692 [Kickxella alabastrina]KAI7827740.1 hypothetical protein BX661DRAFT_16692 [Kickxella alabastrina]